MLDKNDQMDIGSSRTSSSSGSGTSASPGAAAGTGTRNGGSVGSTSSGTSGSPGGTQNQGGQRSGSSASSGASAGTGARSDNSSGSSGGDGSNSGRDTEGFGGGGGRDSGAATGSTGMGNYDDRSSGGPGGAGGVRGTNKREADTVGGVFGSFQSNRNNNALANLNRSDRALVETASALHSRYGGYGMSIPDAYGAAAQYGRSVFGETGKRFANPKDLAAVSQVMMNRLDAAYMKGQYGGSWQSALKGFDANPAAAKRTGQPLGNSAFQSAKFGTTGYAQGLQSLANQLTGQGPALPDQVMNATNYATPKADKYNGYSFGPHNFSNPDPGRPATQIAANREAIDSTIGGGITSVASTKYQDRLSQTEDLSNPYASKQYTERISPNMDMQGYESPMASVAGAPSRKEITDRLSTKQFPEDRLPVGEWASSAAQRTVSPRMADLMTAAEMRPAVRDPGPIASREGIFGDSRITGGLSAANVSQPQSREGIYGATPVGGTRGLVASVAEPQSRGGIFGYDPVQNAGFSNPPMPQSRGGIFGYDPTTSSMNMAGYQSPMLNTSGMPPAQSNMEMSNYRSPMAGVMGNLRGPAYDPLTSMDPTGRVFEGPPTPEGPFKNVATPQSREGVYGYDPIEEVVGEPEPVPGWGLPSIPNPFTKVVEKVKTAYNEVHPLIEKWGPYAHLLVPKSEEQQRADFAHWQTKNEVTPPSSTGNRRSLALPGVPGVPGTASPNTPGDVFGSYRLGPAYWQNLPYGIVNSDYSGIGGAIPYV